MGVAELQLGRPLRLDLHAALAMLRDIGSDRAGMAELRRLHARELGRSALHRVPDAQVIMQLAERVAAGALTIALVRAPAPGAPPESQESQGGAAESPPATPPAPEDEMLADVDAEAQAATLVRAAEQGTPFCEECEKKAA